MKIKKYLFIVIFIFSVCILFCCTLFSANGADFVKGGGTLIVKNRDWKLDHDQALKLITPDNGYRYFGLFASGNNSPGLKAGINEKGLVIVSATAGSIPSKIRDEENATKKLMEKLLSRCDGVDSVLKETALFSGAKNLMIADKTKSAVIEIGLKGEYAVSVCENNVIYRTNHFINEKMAGKNQDIGRSSRLRYSRIKELLSEKKLFTLDDFIKISNDRNDGADNSIYRTGKTLVSTRTVSTIGFYLPPEGKFMMYFRIINRINRDEKIYRFDQNEIFK